MYIKYSGKHHWKELKQHTEMFLGGLIQVQLFEIDTKPKHYKVRKLFDNDLKFYDSFYDKKEAEAIFEREKYKPILSYGD